MKNVPVRLLCLGALFVALDIVFTRSVFILKVENFDRLSLQFLPNMLSGIVLGPYLAALSGAAGDILGMLINSDGNAFSPLFTLSAIIRGLLYGLILHKKSLNITRIAIALIAVTVCCDIILTPIWINILYGTNILAILPMKLVVRSVATPIYIVIAVLILRRLKGMISNG